LLSYTGVRRTLNPKKKKKNAAKNINTYKSNHGMKLECIYQEKLPKKNAKLKVYAMLPVEADL